MSTAMDKLTEALNPQALESESRLMDWLVNVPVLALDEVDKMRPTEFRTEKRFELLDQRYERACNEDLYSVTVMAGNENPDRLEGYIADRIHDGRFTTVELKGLSLRPGMEY